MSQNNNRRLWWLASATTLTLEGVTILARVLAGQSAAEFNRTANPPFLLKIHHMFWAAPLILAALVAPRWKFADVLWGLAIGLVASDLLHHFLVLPLWVGNTGWHWP